MSSVLDALTPEQRAEVAEALDYRRLERAIVNYGLGRLLEQALVKPFRVADPGAGLDWAVTVPAGVTWELLQWRTRFATSAVVANRFPTWLIRDPDTNEYGRFVNSAAVAASAVSAISATAGLGDHIAGGSSYIPMMTPPLTLTAGWRIFGQTSSLDVGDVYTQTFFIVREWTPAAVVHAARYLLADLDSAGGIQYP